MSAVIRWQRQRVSAKRVHEQWVTAIHVNDEGKRMRLLVLDADGIHLVTAPLDEGRYMEPLSYRGKPYPVRRAVKKFRAFGRIAGLSKHARNALKTLEVS